MLTPPDLNDIGLASTDQTIDAMIESYKSGLDLLAFSEFSSIQYQLNPVSRLYQKAKNELAYTDRMRDNDINNLRNYNVLNEYADLFLQTGHQDEYNLSFRGGSKKSKYYISLAHKNSESFYGW